MIVLDTTVLVYAVGADHPLRDPCRRVMEAIGSGDLPATTTVEVIQELAQVRARRRGREDAAEVARSYATLLSPLAAPDGDDVERGLALFEHSDRLDAFDAVLASTVLGTDRLTGLLSADRAFAEVRGLRHHDPADPDLLRDLGL